MKPFHYLILLPLFLCASLALMSCESEGSSDIEMTTVSKSGWSTVKHFNYKEHSYILFSWSQYSNGIVHDPDCPCSKGHNPEVEK
jgi:hypothetical protein